MITAIILLIIGFCFVILEVFIPSGGMITVVALATVITSIYFAFSENTTVGVLFLVISIVGLPIVAYYMLKLFPKTAAGRRFILFGPSGHEEVATSSELKLRQFEGKCGVTKTTLRPAGVAEIDGERVNVVSEGMIIESDTAIEVIEVSGNRIVVSMVENSSGRAGEAAS